MCMHHKKFVWMMPISESMFSLEDKNCLITGNSVTPLSIMFFGIEIELNWVELKF